MHMFCISSTSQHISCSLCSNRKYVPCSYYNRTLGSFSQKISLLLRTSTHITIQSQSGELFLLVGILNSHSECSSVFRRFRGKTSITVTVLKTADPISLSNNIITVVSYSSRGRCNKLLECSI